MIDVESVTIIGQKKMQEILQDLEQLLSEEDLEKIVDTDIA